MSETIFSRLVIIYFAKKIPLTGQESHEYTKFIRCFDGNKNAPWFYSNPKSGDTMTIVAAREGNLKLLHQLKKRILIKEKLKAVLEQTNRTGKRPIHEAAQNGHLEVLAFLIEAGVDVNGIKQQDWTPLMLACTKSNADVVRFLLKKGADVSLKNKDGWNCFHIAAREGVVSVLEALLDSKSDLWDTKSKNGRTPLHTAALHGRHDAVTSVLLTDRCRYAVDTKDSCGSTPLMEACRAGFVDVMSALVSLQGANIFERDHLDRTLLHIAAETGQNISIMFLLSYNVMPMMVDVRKEFDSITSVRRRIDVNSETCQGCTALYLASREGHCSTIELLLNQPGVLINASDRNGRTALHMTVIKRSVPSVQLLITRGAVDCRDKEGKLARDYAADTAIKQLFDS